MKLKKIKIKNVLSYKEEIIEFNNNLNIFVGANGSGKSNLINIIIYILKKYCYKNFEISRTTGLERAGYIKYSIREKNPLYNSSENFFMKKHKLLENESSRISFNIEFEDIDKENLDEMKKYKESIISFLDTKIDSIHYMDNPYQVNLKEVKKFFDINAEGLMLKNEIEIVLEEEKDKWFIKNDKELEYMIFMKYFSLMYDLLSLMKIKHNVKNPFVFFEAYRNNARETTKVTISDYNDNYVNTQSLENMSNFVYSIGTNSTYIMLATKKFGEKKRQYIEKENGFENFKKDKEYVNLKKFFKKFEYEIELECIEPNNNIYQFYLKKDDLKIEIDTISSGEREIINFIFGLFLEKLNGGIVIIDEPELHLHPSWQKKLIQILKTETNGNNIQIMFVTHSTSFIEYNTLNNIYRIYKDKEFSKCIRIENLVQDVDEFRKSLSVVNATNNEKIFFSNYVVMVEGITDEILFKKIYESNYRKVPEGLEFIAISGKKNLNNFKNVLDALKIKYFYIGDFDNLFDYHELDAYFEIDLNEQEYDLSRKKNQTYACLDLLKSIEEYLNDNSQINLINLKVNYNLYNERFKKIKKSLTTEERNEINKFIETKYEEGIYILKSGEIEQYLHTGSKNKAVGFKKVISFITDEEEYNKFKEYEEYNELKEIISNINSKIIQ